MNLILLFPEDFIAVDRVRLFGRRFDHITTVLKSKHGDMLTVGLCDGQIGKGEVVSITEGVELAVKLDQPPPSPLPMTLVLALPRPHLFKRALFFAAMLGIKDIHVINFSRVEKSLWNSRTLREESVREYLTLGLEQAKDTRMPQVTLHPQFKPFVQDALPKISQGCMKILAHPGGIDELAGASKGPIVLVIGPEGGITPFELELFEAEGFIKAGFGPRILRVDAALTYITAKLF